MGLDEPPKDTPLYTSINKSGYSWYQEFNTLASVHVQVMHTY